MAGGQREVCIPTIHALTVTNNQQLSRALGLMRGRSQPHEKTASAINCHSQNHPWTDVLGQLHTDEHGLSESAVEGRKASLVEARSKEKSCKIHHFFLQNLGVKSKGFRKNTFVQSLLKPHLKLKHNQKLRKGNLSKYDNVQFYRAFLCLSLPPVARKKAMPGSKGKESPQNQN